MAVEGQRCAKNATLIPSVRTLTDFKLAVDLYRGSTSLELYRGSSLLGSQPQWLKIIDLLLGKRGGSYMLYLGSSNPNS
ncbi:hypothetical protein BHE74_00006124 [Ensete ventricosum]|nr:hypothetical protein GW17_00057413 [Ensete ventricosum]RWW85220.1 hypothetical protein BHE74_00006124 [Ensete ventricosum]